MEIKTVNNELWKIEKSAQFSNRSSIMIDDAERIMVIEHYRDNVKEREYYENLIVTAVNACKTINPDNPLNAAKMLPAISRCMNEAYDILSKFGHNWEGRDTIGGQLLLATMRDLKQATE